MICETCQRSFRDNYALRRHRQSHEGTSTMEMCTKCNGVFKHLKNHFINCKAPKPKILNVAFAAFHFSEKKNLSMHIKRKHTLPKLYPCGCRKSFLYPFSVKRHSKTCKQAEQMILKSSVISRALLFTISSRYYYFIDCLLDNLNSNLLFNLSEGYITMESALFHMITTCLQYTSIMYNYMRMSPKFKKGLLFYQSHVSFIMNIIFISVMFENKRLHWKNKNGSSHHYIVLC